jgi:hypothetical protein
VKAHGRMAIEVASEGRIASIVWKVKDNNEDELEMRGDHEGIGQDTWQDDYRSPVRGVIEGEDTKSRWRGEERRSRGDRSCRTIGW